MAYKRIMTEAHFQGLELQPSQYGYRVDMLTKLLAVMNYACTTSKDVVGLRFDVRFPGKKELPDGTVLPEKKYPDDNHLFEQFIAAFVQDRSRHGIDLAYFWVRERDTSINHHYHVCIFILDHDTSKWTYNHLAVANRQWHHKLGLDHDRGLVNFCMKDQYGQPQENEIIIKKGGQLYPAHFMETFKRFAYTCKAYSKGFGVPPRTREYGSSLMPALDDALPGFDQNMERMMSFAI